MNTYEYLKGVVDKNGQETLFTDLTDMISDYEEYINNIKKMPVSDKNKIMLTKVENVVDQAKIDLERAKLQVRNNFPKILEILRIIEEKSKS